MFRLLTPLNKSSGIATLQCLSEFSQFSQNHTLPLRVCAVVGLSSYAGTWQSPRPGISKSVDMTTIQLLN